MDQIRAIQEIVDSNKGDIPTGVVVNLMKECQNAHTEQPPELYRLTWTKVDLHAYVTYDNEESDGAAEPLASGKMCYGTQTIIVEAVDVVPGNERDGYTWEGAIPDGSMMLKRWLNAPKPIVMRSRDDGLRIINSIEPFVPKRPRSEEE